jgi:uncharacterized protein YndB with AHSA1/START domain
MTTGHTTRIAPVVKRVVVPVPPERAFHVFTVDIDEWWPLATHSVGLDLARHLTFELSLGGRITEHGDDGPISEWGTITEWDPPHVVAFTWHPGWPPDQATSVAVRFTAVAGGTEVELTHSDWHRRPDGAEARGRYDSGWPYTLEQFAAAAA